MKPIEQMLYFSKKTINMIVEKINSNEIKMQFRKNKTDFTRKRKLPFNIMVVLILQK
jgi:hypothetical protein